MIGDTAGRFVVMYQATGSGSIGRGVCGNIASGATTATMGTIVTWASTSSAFIESIGYDKTADKFITSYGDMRCKTHCYYSKSKHY